MHSTYYPKKQAYEVHKKISFNIYYIFVGTYSRASSSSNAHSKLHLSHVLLTFKISKMIAVHWSLPFAGLPIPLFFFFR